MATKMARVFQSSIFADFLQNVVAAKNNGCGHLYVMQRTSTKANKKQHYVQLIRCDRKAEVLVRHSLNGKEYLPWDETIQTLAKEKRELFFSINSFYGAKRSNDNVCALQTLFIDIDQHNKNQIINLKDIKEFVALLERKLLRDELPVPYAVMSGRGLHLYWPIKNCEKKDACLWSAVERELGKYVQDLADDQDYMTGWDVDVAAMDTARIARIPGTYNKSAKRWSSFIPTRYSDAQLLDTFLEFFHLNEKKEKRAYRKRVSQENTAKSVSHAERVYAHARMCALEQFAYGRNLQLNGKRNTFTTIYASMAAIADHHKTEKLTLDFCQKFRPAQNKQEILDTAICCKIKYYSWRDETIFDRLGMNAQEISKYKATVKKVCYQGKVFRGKSNKTRDSERQKRKEEKARLYAKIPRLYVSGKSIETIAKELNVSRSTVSRHLNSLLLSSNNRSVKRYRKNRIRKKLKKATQNTQTELCNTIRSISDAIHNKNHPCRIMLHAKETRGMLCVQNGAYIKLCCKPSSLSLRFLLVRPC